MVSTDAGRSEAFASQADRSRDQAAGYLQQTIATAKSVMLAKAQISQWLASISIPFRWEGTRLVLQGSDGQWVVGPDLAGVGITKAEIVDGHLALTFSSGIVSDLGQVVPDGDFVGPPGSIDGEILLFDGTTGKRGKGSGKTVSSFAAAAHSHAVAALSDASALAREILQADDAPSMRLLLQLVKGTAPGDIPVLDGSGKLDSAILPALAITETFVVNNQAAMLALSAQQGDVAVRTDLSKTFILSTNNPGALADWKEILTPTALLLTIDGQTGNPTIGGIVAGSGSKSTPIDADLIPLSDSASGNATRKLSWANLKAALKSYFDAIYQPAGVATALPTLIVRDEKPSGTDGGSASATTWNARTFNTVVANTIPGATLGSDRVTIPAGTYDFVASAPAYVTAAHKLRLYNVTDASPLFVGENALVPSGPITSASLTGRFTISGAKTIALEHYTAVARATDGLGKAVSAASTIEVYATLTLRKVS